MNYLFPAAFMANTFAMTAMMIVLGLAGKPEVAADFGIVLGATVALFYSFSANARSIVLNPASPIKSGVVLGSRLLLVIPLAGLSLILSMHFAAVEPWLAFALVLRRSAEWLAEVHVSEMELGRENPRAARFLVLQIVLFLVVAFWLLADLPFAPLILFAWATSPAWLSLRFIRREARIDAAAGGSWLRLLPHFGSTAVIGISVYVFRLLILLLTGKAVAGDLYTAFAIGGLIGSVFAQAIGPTLALQEARGISSGLPSWIRAVLVLMAVLGLSLYVVAEAGPQWLEKTGKAGFFWVATGLSLIGGVIMVIAQGIRLRILQHHADGDVFGPDVLMNILIVAAVPYVFYLAGRDGLAALYLLSSVMALVFYYSAGKGADLRARITSTRAVWTRALIALLLLVPVFFQLSGTIFRETAYIFDTAGKLMQLPIPLSVLACYGGIVLLGGYARAHLSLTTIFATFTLMLISSVMLAHGQAGQEQAKLILLIQFVLPMFALVLGQLFAGDRAEEPVLEKVFLWLLAVIVPAQLIATWAQGKAILTPYLYLFSIYQHIQYVVVMFVAAYLLALYSLWETPRYRFILLALLPLMSVYAASTASVLAMAALIAGVGGFAIYTLSRKQEFKTALSLISLVLVFSTSYFFLATQSKFFSEKFQLIQLEADAGTGIKAPQNVVQRFVHWKFYATAIVEDARSAALGHATPPDRTRHPSAHNYYLDFAYNFGLIALLPLLALVGLTVIQALRRWRDIAASAPFLGLAIVVLFLVLLDNSLKVGMRQPYPGILTFFLWGVLLTRLFAPRVPSGGERPA